MYEQIIMRLQYYFAHSSTEEIPYAEIFQHNYINVMQYLYSYMQTNCLHNQQRLTKYAKQICQNPEKCIESILDTQGSLQFYFNRIINMPTILSNLTKGASPTKQLEQNLAIALLQKIKSMSIENQIYVTNKLLILGYSRLICSKLNLYIVELYPYLLKKQKILLWLLVDRGCVAEILKNYKVNDQLAVLLQSPPIQLKVSQTQQLYELLNKQNAHGYVKQILNLLLDWWACARDHLITTQAVHFKTNLLALIIRNTPSSQIISSCSTQLAQGIHKRLVQPTQNLQCMLIWKQMADKLDFKVDERIKNTPDFKDEPIIHDQLISATSSKEKQQMHTIHTRQQQKTKKIKSGDSSSSDEDRQQIINIIKPTNISDCLFGLQNKKRRKKVLSELPKLIRENPREVKECFELLFRHLSCPLHVDHHECMVVMLVMQPVSFIQATARILQSRIQFSLDERINLIKVIEAGLIQLASNPEHQKAHQQSQLFYFKKVKSTYFKETSEIVRKQPQQTKRWGHTRIAYENRDKCNLKIVNNDPYVNRLYQVATLLFYKLITPLTVNIATVMQKHPILAKHILTLLGTLATHIVNNLEKYILLTDIIKICEICINQLQLNPNSQIQNNTMVMAIIHTLRNCAQVLDPNVPENLLQSLQKSIAVLTKLPHYGLKPLLEMLYCIIYDKIKGPSH